MSTVSLAIGATQTDSRFRRDLLQARFALADVNFLSLASRELRRGEEFTLAFTKLLFVSVNIPTLIRLTTSGDTVEFTLPTSMLLPIEGSVLIENPSNNPIVEPIEVRYVAI